MIKWFILWILFACFVLFIIQYNKSYKNRKKYYNISDNKSKLSEYSNSLYWIDNDYIEERKKEVNEKKEKKILINIYENKKNGFYAIWYSDYNDYYYYNEFGVYSVIKLEILNNSSDWEKVSIVDNLNKLKWFKVDVWYDNYIIKWLFSEWLPNSTEWKVECIIDGCFEYDYYCVEKKYDSIYDVEDMEYILVVVNSSWERQFLHYSCFFDVVMSIYPFYK